LFGSDGRLQVSGLQTLSDTLEQNLACERERRKKAEVALNTLQLELEKEVVQVRQQNIALQHQLALPNGGLDNERMRELSGMMCIIDCNGTDID
jgi:hypothetical protein